MTGLASHLRRGRRPGDAFGGAWRFLRAVCSQVRTRVQAPRLRLAERLSLGDKQFIAIVEVEGERLLLGGGTGAITLLTRLGSCAAGLPASCHPAVPYEVHSAERMAEVGS